MSTLGYAGQGFNPNWAANGNLFGTSSETSLSFVTTPANPLGGRYIEGTTACSAYIQVNPLQEKMTVPDNTKRWACRWFRLFRKDGNPSAQMNIWGETGNLWNVKLNTDGTLTLTVVDSHTGTLALSNNTDYALDLWQIVKTSTGADLTTCHWVLRVYTLGTAGNPATTVETIQLFNIAGGAESMGQNTQSMYSSDATIKTYGGNFVAHVEDADNPFGVLRIDDIAVTSDGSFNGLTGTYADWDEAAPNDATDKQTKIYAVGQSAEETSTLAATGIGASDTVLFLMMFRRELEDAVAKGGALLSKGEIFKPNTHVYTAETGVQAGGYITKVYAFKTNLSGSAWAVSDLSSLEIGVVVRMDPGAPVGAAATYNGTAVRAQVVYQKSGETIDALPTTPATGEKSQVMTF